ncbi:DUF4328 domain-containing protein [Umezawaea endophytica]|uniref:DUF4328 domain-containing protein n=1 Tax=Umezawaea endophytica TaxID=1654476 RepID=A0A9X3A3E4_9PSEU|nr:DUF4328 domain-containing protein [Umezawaea endophytica]MCS7481649.1 DUF4328 domain-containing protein [Umezawaea endophytica]
MDSTITLRPHVVSTPAGLLYALLAAQAVVQPLSAAVPLLRYFAALLFACTAPVLLVWLHRVRRNAEVPGRVHRWSPRWVVGVWFVPVLNLWAPYQAVADVAAAGAPESQRAEVTRQVLAWWLAWLVGLAATGSRLLPAWVGAVFSALACVLLIAVVRKLTAMHPADERLISGM